MSDTVIRVENVSKQYRLGVVGAGTLRDDLNRWWAKLRGKEDPFLKVTETNVRDRTKAEKLKTEKLKGRTEDSALQEEPETTGAADRETESGVSPFQHFSVSASQHLLSDYVWALKDISFEVKRGEVLGIIGANGAGKSTLLKILSRVTAPTQGRIRVKGRIASLLEVGTGFHPELTGRENVYLNGAIMGMTRAEVTGRLDEIVAFSGCDRYIDTPVKRYSSGMKVRLGFAVAAHLEPEILIVDEVLAVGDAEFQKKCLGKMKDVAGHGRTVLFVSHNMAAVSDLCSRAILLKNGKLADEGDVVGIIEKYLTRDVARGRSDLSHWQGERDGEGPIRFTMAQTLDAQGNLCDRFAFGEALRVSATIQVPEAARGMECIIAISVTNAGGQRIMHLLNTDARASVRFEDSVGVVEMTIPELVLNDGDYYISLWVGDTLKVRHDKVSACLQFIVESSRQGPHLSRGLIRQQALWKQL